MTSASKTKPLPVYVIHGHDDYLRTQALHDTVTALLGQDRDHMAYAEFEGVGAAMADVLDEVRTPSLLAPLRVVCVRNADPFISLKPEEEGLEENLRGGEGGRSGGKHRRPRTNREMLEGYLESPCPTGVLILECRSFMKTTKLYKMADKIGRILSCETPKRWELPGWITNHAERVLGCKLEYAVADRLADLVGEQLGLLHSELEKLATYVAPRKFIGVADVDNLVGASREEKVFAITDAIARRDAGKALALWEQVLATDRNAPYRAIGGLAFGFRKLTEARRLLDQGAPLAEAAKAIKPWGAKPAELPDLKRQIGRFSLRQWQDHLVQLLRIDAGAKSGLGTVPSAVEKFIVKLCAAT